jgi:CysZ protein
MRPGFFLALTYPFRGLALLRRRRDLWTYAAWAFLLNFAALAALSAAFFYFLPQVADRLTPAGTLAWLGVLVSCLLTLAWIVLLLFLSTILGHLIAGPFLDAMTERVLAGLGEALPPPRGLPSALGRSVLNQILKLAFFGTCQGGLLLLLATPAAVLYPPLSAIATVLFLGFEFLDYPLDARALGVPARVRYLLAHPGPTLGYGTACFLIALVPLLGYLALPLTVAGAALLVHDIDPSGPKV